MHSFDPRDWWGPDEVDARRDRQGDPNRDRLLLFCLASAICLCLASFAPPGLVVPLAVELFTLAALGSAAGAALRGESLFAGRLTAWDQAAALMLLALLLRLAFLNEAAAFPGEAAAP